jgi:DNA-binding response OmpR family regulator
MKLKKLLLVEDDEDISSLIKTLFEQEQFDVEIKSSADDALVHLSLDKPDIIIMDLKLPGVDGFELTRIIKSKKELADIPIIIISGKYLNAEDKIHALDLGADDYITKPFSLGELLARVNSVLRRVSAGKLKEKVLFDDELEINIEQHVVKVKDETVYLTPKEFDLLYYLVKNNERLLSREELLSSVWGKNYFGETRTVDVHINRLREKLPKKFSSRIKTCERLGYKWSKGK